MTGKENGVEDWYDQYPLPPGIRVRDVGKGLSGWLNRQFRVPKWESGKKPIAVSLEP
jgi:hypothetical protein